MNSNGDSMWRSTTELYHHGIKGQRWGVRRTAAQLGHKTSKAVKKAASSAAASTKKAVKARMKTRAAERAKKKAEKAEIKEYQRLKKTPIRKLTDKDIAKLNKRLDAEKKVKSIAHDAKYVNAKKFYDTFGKTFYDATAKSTGSQLGLVLFKNSKGNSKNDSDESKPEKSKIEKVADTVKRGVDAYKTIDESMSYVRKKHTQSKERAQKSKKQKEEKRRKESQGVASTH